VEINKTVICVQGGSIWQKCKPRLQPEAARRQGVKGQQGWCGGSNISSSTAQPTHTNNLFLWKELWKV